MLNLNQILKMGKRKFKSQKKIPWFFSGFTRIVFVFILLHAYCVLYAQDNRHLRIVFYNAENFFDIKVDSTRDYNAFTPEGDQHWTLSRYFLKRNNLFKTLLALGKGDPPALVGMCELENESVLEELIYRTPLKNAGYKIVHYESPDRRGIDVGLIYRSDLLTLIQSEPINVHDTADPGFLTRDILFAAFETSASDTIFVYVNHWPSRYGGQLESVDKRMLAATTLRRHYDSLVLKLPGAKVVMMGDLNDSPEDDSVLKGLRAFSYESNHQPDGLINLFTNKNSLGFDGTLKHVHDWQIFDQIIVSPALFGSEMGTRYCDGSARIFVADFLLEDDDRYLGKKLHRTYSGPNYIGGFSDHLPVYIDLCLPD